MYAWVVSYVNLIRYIQIKKYVLYVCHVYMYFYNYGWGTDKEIIIVTELAFVGQTIYFFLYKMYAYRLHLKEDRARKTLTKHLDLNGKY